MSPASPSGSQLDPFVEGLRLESVSPSAAREVLVFELRNRDYFERFVPPRPAAYFELEGLRGFLASLADEQRAGLGWYFLAREGLDGRLVGRLNLTRRAGPDSPDAVLGYRIGREFGGLGVATRMVALALEEVRQAGIRRVHASTVLEHRASQKVLERNGFELVGRAAEGLELHGSARDRLDYRWDAAKARPSS